MASTNPHFKKYYCVWLCFFFVTSASFINTLGHLHVRLLLLLLVMLLLLPQREEGEKNGGGKK